MTQTEALSILKTGANAFLTGEPGAGKTHTINAYVRYLREHDVEVAITASTGIAATHIGGMTIHSWSGIGIRRSLGPYDLDSIASNEYISKRIRRARVLVIDEISMLSPETLTMIDMVCREVLGSPDPFGGLQVIFVGDFFQLPPIMKRDEAASADSLFGDEPAARFAYDSQAWRNAQPLICYLSEQHRQDDDIFLGILSAIRNNIFGEAHLKHIAARKIEGVAVPASTPKLFSHNIDVNSVNDDMLSHLTTKFETFVMTSDGSDGLVAALKKGCLSPETLTLKVGAEVMFTKNNPKERYVNGTLGTIVGFELGTHNPIVRTRDDIRITVERADWVIEENGKIKARITQMPLRLAWAITIHKSQGMSMDEAVMDLSDVFEYGQGYVALSRVRRLSGLYLLGWNERTFQVDAGVLEKDIEFRARAEEAQEAFAAIEPAELKKMQDNFITASGGRLVGTPGGAKKLDTKHETLALWREGKTISEIARARKLKEKTIFDHVEELVEKKEISVDEIMRLVPEKLAKAMSEIHTAFAGEEKLTPVFEKLKGKYSFDDLRVARMLLKK
jgi:ATP-dependent DNA helicase PIF1